MSNRFDGHVALVTGAEGEIAQATVRALLRQGAQVWAVDVRPSTGEEQAHLHTREIDITDADAVHALFDRIAAESGGPDLVVNAAGGPGQVRTPIDEVTDDAWHRVLDLNLDGVFHVCREAARVLKAQSRPGSIVNISSGAGRTYSRTGVQAYAAAKAGVIGLTRQLARELGPASIRVNCVAPGLIVTNGTRTELAALSTDEVEAHLAGIALGRLGEPSDLVEPILFFLRDEAGYVTGQTISADGGSIMLG